MALQKSDIIRAGLETLYHSRLYRMFEPSWRGLGAVFMLHHIRRRTELVAGFHPNSCLETSPEYLVKVLERLQDRGIEFVSLAEAVERTRLGENASRFAAFTIDDGYLDNYTNAWPIFRKFGCPFTVFVATKIIDGTAELWWLALEKIIAANDEVTACVDGEQNTYKTSTSAQKQSAYQSIYWYWRGLPERDQRRKARNLCACYGVSLERLCRSQAMTWDQLRELNADPLVTIGAHTVNHVALAKLEEGDASREMTASRQRLEKELDQPVDFFCYPYGDPGSAGAREFDLAETLNFKAAVTTRKGLLYDDHGEHLTALPRVSLNGDYEDLKYIELYLSGAPFALWNKFRKVDAT